MNQPFLPFGAVPDGAAVAPATGRVGVGTLLGIARRLVSRAPMETLEEAQVTLEHGVFGDFRGKAKADGRVAKRQVTVLRREGWADAEAEIGHKLPWTMRRTNFLVEGLAMPRARGFVIAIGADIRLRVSGECDPCRRMDEQQPGLWPALVPDWRGGYLTTVIAGGIARLGDEVRIDDHDAI